MPGDNAQTGDEVRLGECPLCGDPMRKSALSFWHAAGTDSGCPLARVSFPNDDIPRWNTRAPRPNGEVEKALGELARRAESFWAFVQGEYNVKFTSEDQDDHNVYEFFAALTRAREVLARARAAREGEKP